MDCVQSSRLCLDASVKTLPLPDCRVNNSLLKLIPLQGRPKGRTMTVIFEQIVCGFNQKDTQLFFARGPLIMNHRDSLLEYMEEKDLRENRLTHWDQDQNLVNSSITVLKSKMILGMVTGAAYQYTVVQKTLLHFQITSTHISPY